MLKSTDGGATWNPAANRASGVDRPAARRIASRSPSRRRARRRSTRDGALRRRHAASTTSHVYKTINSGASWTETSLVTATPAVSIYLGTQAWYDNTIVVAPADANTVIAGGVYYAQNHGRRRDVGLSDVHRRGAVTSTHTSSATTPAGTLWIANDGGIWTSTDHGTSATNRNANLVTRQYYAMANDP